MNYSIYNDLALLKERIRKIIGGESIPTLEKMTTYELYGKVFQSLHSIINDIQDTEYTVFRCINKEDKLICEDALRKLEKIEKLLKQFY